MIKIIRYISAFTLGSLPILGFTQIPKQYTQLAPAGWMVLSGASGDLNNDGRNDIALILEEKKTDHPLSKENGKALHNNKRKLSVFLNTTQGYTLTAENLTIPVAEQPNSCLLDPLAEADGVSINKGVLSIGFSYFMSCGGWEWPRHHYAFRWQNNHFELIGFDYYSFHRASGEETNKSYNFSTMKRKEIVGGNMFETHKTQTKWNNFKTNQKLTLTNINFDDFYSQFEY